MPAAVLNERRRAASKSVAEPSSSHLLAKVRSMQAAGESIRSQLAQHAREQPAALRREVGKLARTVRRLHEELARSGAANEEFPEAAETARSMISKGDLLDSAAFAERMGWTKQVLSKALAAHRVFFLEVHGLRYFPAFYADRLQERRNLEAATKVLGDLPGSSKLQFFTNPRGSLSRLTPLRSAPASCARTCELLPPVPP